MKKIFTSLILSLLFTSQVQAWWIDEYKTNIEILESGTIVVTEEIQANFTTDPRHGIYRNIPTKITKEDGHTEKLRTNLISITDDQGTTLPYSTTHTTTATTHKIGDENILIQAPQTYIITYEVANGLSYFEDHDEIYWNAVGTEWETEILKATATIILPDGITSIQDIQTICYTGVQDSSKSDCSTHVQDLATATFQTTKSLNYYEGLTIAVAFPTGLVDQPNTLLWAIQDYWPIILIPLAFVILFRRWQTYGKDVRVHTIVPEYEPPKEISPIETSILLDEKADMRDMSAILINLAIQGFIKIEEIEEKTLKIFKHKNYILHRLKESQENSLQSFEQSFLSKIFEEEKEIKISDLKNKFYKHLPKLRKELYEAAMQKKLFTKNPEKAKTSYIIAGVVQVVIGFTLMTAIAFFTTGVILGLSLAASGILTVIFGFYMSKKTTLGHELYKKLLGLKLYIETAEKDRIKFHEKEHHFEQLLPYAIIFNQTKHWAKQFEDIYKSPPDWYTSSSWGAASAFSLTDFTHNLDNCTSAINTSLSSSPGGGGSGFGGGAGGGGGGGGGGAW